MAPLPPKVLHPRLGGLVEKLPSSGDLKMKSPVAESREG